jgi:uncharacterized protein YaaN involved in tellurite resistance
MARKPTPINFNDAPQTEGNAAASGSIGVTKVMNFGAQASTVPSTSPMVGKPLTMEDVDTAGKSTQLAIAGSTKKIMEMAKLSDMDDLGLLLGKTLTSAKGYDPAGIKPGVGGFFKKLMGIGESLRQKVESADAAVNDLVKQIDNRMTLFTSRVRDLQQIADQNMAYYHTLEQEKLRMLAGVQYMEANPPAVDVNDPASIAVKRDWDSVIAWARKRADDLGRAQIVAQQQDAQIALMRDNGRALVSKFGDLKTTTLPILQQTFLLYVINVEQKKGAEFSDSIDALTNDTLTKNAALLGQNTVQIHTSLNRSNFSIEAITANHNAVIQALDDIDRIRLETKNRLASEAPLLEQKSKELAARLASVPTT